MRTLPRLCLTAALGLLAAAPAAATTDASQALVFQALLDGDPIGVHEFRIREQDSGRVVESRAKFDVSVLFVTVFRYRHRNTEVWQDGCLQRLDSETDSNGTTYDVDVRSQPDGYRVVTEDDSRFYPLECLMSFAYWDRRFLERDRLLNAQTGELIDVRIESLGTTELDWPGVGEPVEGFHIVSEPDDVDIKVYYRQGDGRWTGLESVLESGRVMRYVPAGEELAASLGDDGAPAETER